MNGEKSGRRTNLDENIIFNIGPKDEKPLQHLKEKPTHRPQNKKNEKRKKHAQRVQ